MKRITIAVVFFLGACVLSISASDVGTCSSTISKHCTAEIKTEPPLEAIKKTCHSQYSGIKNVEKHLQEYINTHIVQSYKYLAMATLFSSYAKDREGFEKLYRKMSDDAWKDAVELTKYMTKRGLDVNFNADANKINGFNLEISKKLETNEIASLSIALDMHKRLALDAHIIHGAVTKRNCNPDKNKPLTEDDCAHHDAEVVSYIENSFVHKHADSVRTLAGYITDLSQMLTSKKTPQLEVYYFDQYLKKVVS